MPPAATRDPSAIPRSGLLPIRTVATLTGVNPVTLRAWERRYGLLKPLRTEGGHRLYAPEDVDTVHRVLDLVGRGMTISQAGQAVTVGAATPSPPHARDIEAMLAAVARFDEASLEAVHSRLLAQHSLEVVTRQVLLPLICELGERWKQSDQGVAEEHFFAVYLRNRIGAQYHHRTRRGTGPKLLLACLPGEHHEFGLLLFALSAHDQGYRPVVLGANMPLGEIPLAAQRAGASGIVLSSSIEPADRSLFTRRLPDMVRSSDQPVYVGGHASVLLRDLIVQAGAEPLGSDIEAALRRIGERVPPRAG